MAQKIDLSQIITHRLVQKCPIIVEQEQPDQQEHTEQQQQQAHRQEEHQQHKLPTPQPKTDIQLRRGSLSSNSLRLSMRSQYHNKLSENGLYNNDFPSPRPNVVLPNFSISSYSDRRSSWREYE